MVDRGFMIIILDVSIYDCKIDDVLRSPKCDPKAVLYLRLKGFASARKDSEIDDSECWLFFLYYKVC